MVQEMVRTRGVSGYGSKKENFDFFRERPDSTRKDLKKSYIVEDTPYYKQTFKDVSNTTKNTLEPTHGKYATKTSDLGREFDSCARQVRTGANFDYENAPPATNYRKRVESTNFRSTTS